MRSGNRASRIPFRIHRTTYAIAAIARSGQATTGQSRTAAVMATTPVAITRAKYAGRRPAITADIPSPIERVEVAEQAEIQPEAREAHGGRGDRDGRISAENGVHARGEGPELQDHDQRDDGEDPVRDRDLLVACELRARVHVSRSSTPVATTQPSRSSSVTRARGRRGGPSSGLPLRR